MAENVTFSGYTDALAGIKDNASMDFRKLISKIRKMKMRKKKLQKALKEQRLLEERRKLEDQRATAEIPKKEQSFLSKVGNTILKAIPKVLSVVAGILAKFFFGKWA